ncbi:hypothetical protein SS50377_25135 [Spironucleus salmonicida]|uniref:Uncharacterized protein n=1 Tax=Spironucleus salmonicida TaxID=348837 RepID=V6LK34_9EUKA|nr:hypothetical protein SS50377_25135 [Spironucleus salmonicida]|eukprot:EST44683.1 Hypothetical protein SS50377_15393 [Spironucleus salmonicida]
MDELSLSAIVALLTVQEQICLKFDTSGMVQAPGSHLYYQFTLLKPDFLIDSPDTYQAVLNKIQGIPADQISRLCIKRIAYCEKTRRIMILQGVNQDAQSFADYIKQILGVEDEQESSSHMEDLETQEDTAEAQIYNDSLISADNDWMPASDSGQADSSADIAIASMFLW